MNIEFSGPIWFWRGPAPFYFVTMPAKESRRLKEVSGLLTYGWGVIPVSVRIGSTEWKTSLFPKEGRYLVPIKDSVRKAERLNEGDRVTIRLLAEPRPSANAGRRPADEPEGGKSKTPQMPD